MAKIKIEEIIGHLESELKSALEEAIENQNLENDVDIYTLFSDFKRATWRKCNDWESVPDRYVKKDSNN